MTIPELEKSIDALPFEVDAGVLIRGANGGYYVSDDPPPPFAWAMLRREHARSGLWPVFLVSHEEAPRDDFWFEEGIGFTRIWRADGDADRIDPDEVLARQWSRRFDLSGDPVDEAEEVARTAPFGQAWPGPAPPGPASPVTAATSADLVAEDFAERLVLDDNTRLGLFRVGRGADVPNHGGWWGGDELDPAEVSAVLRSWEDRFGARLIRLGFDSIVLSVAAPPTTLRQAQHVAAEHFAFCQEIIGYTDGAFARHAEELVGRQHWLFWWERDADSWL